jgi:hypothetical protein
LSSSIAKQLHFSTKKIIDKALEMTASDENNIGGERLRDELRETFQQVGLSTVNDSILSQCTYV